jgi:acetoin utilization protein AcuB
VVAGMISQRDLGLLEANKPERLTDIKVEEAMSGEPYIVSPDAPLQAVIGTMHAHKIGSAIVVDQGKVLGVFTTTDAIALLREVLASAA